MLSSFTAVMVSAPARLVTASFTPFWPECSLGGGFWGHGLTLADDQVQVFGHELFFRQLQMAGSMWR